MNALEQRLTALERANEVRIGWKDLKAKLRAGELSVGDAMYAECAQGRWLWHVLEAQSGWGPCRVAKALCKLGIEDRVSLVSELSGGERRMVARMFPPLVGERCP